MAAEDGRQVSVTVDEELMTKAMRSVLEKGIAEGIGSWEVQRQVREAVERSIDAGSLPEKIEAALNQRLELESTAIIEGLVEDVMPLMRTAFTTAFKTSLATMIFGICLGAPGPGYAPEENKAAWRRAQELMGEHVPENES